MRIHNLIVVLTALWVGGSPLSAQAMRGEAEAQFKIVMDMPLGQLGQLSAEVLNETYPDANWVSYNFPDYVYGDQATEMAYKVATQNSSLLGIVNVGDEGIVIPCYCTCDSFGHDNLLYCFYKNGNPKEGFDDHGAHCAVCIRQALLAFLWNDLGATHEEIMAGMKQKFAPLIEKYHQHDQ
jgi:hypothetical protein